MVHYLATIYIMSTMQRTSHPLPQRPQTTPEDTVLETNNYPGARRGDAPSSPVKIRQSSLQLQPGQAAHIETGTDVVSRGSSRVSRKPVGSRPSMGSRQPSIRIVDEDTAQDQHDWPLPSPKASVPVRNHARITSAPPKVYASDYEDPTGHANVEVEYTEEPQQFEQLQYHHTFDSPPQNPSSPPASNHARIPSLNSSPALSSIDGSGGSRKPQRTSLHSQILSRPMLTMTLGSELHSRGRSSSPRYLGSETSLSPGRHSRGASSGRSPDSGHRASTIDLLNIPYSQQLAHQNLAINNAELRNSVGTNASLLDTRRTLEMYRANVKKTNDLSIQYEFALFMVSAAQQEEAYASNLPPNTRSASPVRDAKDRDQLLTEAKAILQKLADRSYVYAQYYLADGLFSGLFNKQKPDMDRAFTLFVSAGKHGHAESSYRAALCYEFGWGCRKDYAKATQFYRQASAKNHPGASTRLGLACLRGEMGLQGKGREGVKWLKRATESADAQHNVAPYELALLHMREHGYADDIGIFKDEVYAAQLFTQAAELGHAEAGLRMGEAYEHGLLGCPRDPALSIHFYTGAATQGVVEAMMALCAWFLVGAEPVLERDEAEAFEWARRSAEGGELFSFDLDW